MKRILVVVTLAIFLVVSVSQASFAGNRGGHHRRHSSKGEVNFAIAVAGVLGLAALGTIVTSRQQPPPPSQYRGSRYQSQAEYNRELQHQQAEDRYLDCLSEQRVDARWGPSVKDCRQLDPENMDWSRK